MADAQIKTVVLTGVGEEDALIKLDASMYKGGGSAGYQSTSNITGNIDDSITIQGVTGVINKIGTMASRSGSGSLVSSDLGDIAGKANLSIIMPVDDATFKVQLLSDIVDKVNTKITTGATVELYGYDLMVESYTYVGTLSNCLNDIAGLIFGAVQYESAEKKYIIVSGDTTYTSPSSNGSLTISEDDLISWELTTEKNTDLLTYGSELIKAAIELAKLRAAMLDITAQASASVSTTKTLKDEIKFSFGNKFNTPSKIPDYLIIDSTAWDTWYVDKNGKNRQQSYDTSDEFVSTREGYFFIEVVKEYGEKDSYGNYTTLGEQRGLYSLDSFKTKLKYRLKNLANTVNTIYAKGYLTNLDSLGLISRSKYKEFASTAAAANAKLAFEDCYRMAYDIEYVNTMVKNSSKTNDNSYTLECIPYICFTASTVSALTYSDDKKMFAFQYGANLEIMTDDVSSTLVYAGYLDKHGRLINSKNQVVLIQGRSDNNYYGPLAGMDMSFIEDTDTSITTNKNTVTTSIGGSLGTLLTDYFDETAIKNKLEAAYTDLRTLCEAQAPLAYTTCAISTTSAISSSYPIYLYEAPITVNDATTGVSTLQNGNLIGVIYGEAEPINAVTLHEYTSVDKIKKQIERKIKCLESKITLITNCIKHNNSKSNITTGMIKGLLKIIITYNTVLARVKNESIATMINMRTDYETALDGCLTSFNVTSGVSKKRLAITAILPDILPAIGSTLEVFGIDDSYTVVSCSVSGINASIVGEINA